LPHTRITIRLPEDDLAWIKSQSDALGLDNEATVVRMLVRQARLGNVSLSVVMQGVEHGVPIYEVDRIPPAPHSRGGLISPSVGEAFAEDAAPVPDEVVNDLLASRMQELATAPPPMLAAVNGQPVQAPFAAVSLRPAPKRQGADYR
jgi:hypothetical protein